MTTISELEFDNLYVRIDQPELGVVHETSYAPKRKPGQRYIRNVILDENTYGLEVERLRFELQREHSDKFSVEWDGMRLRGQRQPCFDGGVEMCLRRLPVVLPNLAEGGFRDEDIEEFLSWGKRTGLVIIGGPTNAGKTTTWARLLHEWLKEHGGVLFTAEDPVEYVFPSRVGESGKVIQTQIDNDEEWAAAAQRAMRFAPNYIAFGEIRTPEAAEHLLGAATAGHLVICTVHGNSPEETIGRVLHIAERAIKEGAADLLANSLTAVIHQTISANGKPQVQILTTEENNMGDGVRDIIRSKKLQPLGTLLEQQKALRDNSPTARRTAPAKPASVPVQKSPQVQGNRPAISVPAKPKPVPVKKGFWASIFG